MTIYTEQGSEIKEYAQQDTRYVYPVYTVLVEKLYAIDGSLIYYEGAASPFTEQGAGTKNWRL